MRHLIDAVRSSVKERNWYAALAGALALPDIAGGLDQRRGASSARFISWYDDYLLPRYTRPASPAAAGATRAAILSGKECYALRCAFLHEGEFDVTGAAQIRMRDVLDRFIFVGPPPGCVIHSNTWNNTLQLQVDIFCEDVCAAVEDWLAARGGDPAVAAAIAALPRIHELSPGGGWAIGPDGVQQV